jgi:hypothetical protein
LTEINFPREPVTFVYRDFIDILDEDGYNDLLSRTIDDLNGGPLTIEGKLGGDVHPTVWYDVRTSIWVKFPDNWAFSGCSKMPIKTRQAIKEMGYEGNF